MSKSPLHAAVHVYFRTAFGEPHRVVKHDHQWALGDPAQLAPIHVLTNGTAEHPIVWVFDPHDENEGATHAVISEETQIEETIASIRDRLERAMRSKGLMGEEGASQG